MELYYPTKRPLNQSQGFNQNKVSLYGDQGMTGHSGLDIVGNYGDIIYSAIDCYLYSTINMGESPDKYRAVYTIIDDKDFSYEVTYGHVIECIQPLKQFVKAGTPIAKMGNFGDVFVGGRKVTKEEREQGSTAGTHLHFQVRKAIKVSKTQTGKKYLRDANGYIKSEGMYYEVVDYNNGVNGCVDPAQFWNQKYANETEKYVFEKDLTIGSTGADVVALQKLLEALGYLVMPIGVSYGYFGPITREAVKKYQIAKGIKPTLGYFGPLTRAEINK